MDRKIRAIIRNGEKTNQPASEEEIMAGWKSILKNIRLYKIIPQNQRTDKVLALGSGQKKEISIFQSIYN